MSTSLKERFRTVAKAGFAAGAHASRLDRLVGRRRGLKDAPFVAGYHRVVENFDRSASLSISPILTSVRTFEQHIDWIGRHYEFVSLDELALILEEEKRSSKPVAAITFDDGYEDVYRNAFPVLKRKGIPSAVFVVTDLVGTAGLLAHDELHLLLSSLLAGRKGPVNALWRGILSSPCLAGEEKRLLHDRIVDIDNPFQSTRVILNTLNRSGIDRVIGILKERVRIPASSLDEFRILGWDMLREMSGEGVTVGSHTRSHMLLGNESADVVRDEVEGSRQVLEQQLDTEVRHFAYPDGSFSANAISAVARAGYRTAHTICGHQDPDHPLLTVSRRMLWQNSCTGGFGGFSPAVLSCQANGIFDPADKCRRRHWG